MSKKKPRLKERYRLVDVHSMSEMRYRYPEAKDRTLRAAWIAPILFMIMLAGALTAICCTFAGTLANNLSLLVGTGVALLVATLAGVVFVFCMAAALALERQRRETVIERMRRHPFPPMPHTLLPPPITAEVKVDVENKTNHHGGTS